MTLEGFFLNSSRWLGILFAIIAATFLLPDIFVREEQSPLASEYIPLAEASAPIFERNTVVQGSEHRVVLHAPALVDLGDNELVAVWKYRKSGKRADTRLYTARFTNGRWEAPELVTTAAATGKELGRYIDKIGNPVLLSRPNKELWLVYVSSIGGWSTSQLNLKRSLDGGRTWSQAERLVTSPFFNLSTLIKTPALELRDGSPVMPAYHEMLARFPELLIFNQTGQVRDKIRMGAGVGRVAIQPAVAVLSQNKAVAMMRPSGDTPTIFETRSEDGGENWSVPKSTELPNPGGPVGLTLAQSGRLLLVFNDDSEKERDLTLAVSIDSGSTWIKLGTLDRLGAGEMAVLTYPFLIRSGDESYHLLYADTGTQTIRHIRFNDTWLDSMLKQARLKQPSPSGPNDAR
jgi:predicted neuraminidase